MNKKRTRDQERNDLWEFLSDVLNEWRSTKNLVVYFMDEHHKELRLRMKLEKELAALKENKP